jgi:hypothetical protein
MIKHEWINTGFILLVAVIALVGIGANNQSQDPSVGSVANTYFRMPNSNAQFKTVTSAGGIVGTTGYFSGLVGVASSTPSTQGDLSIASTGTTTAYLGTTSTTKGGGIEMNNDTGTLSCLYITGTTPTVKAGHCK